MRSGTMTQAFPKASIAFALLLSHLGPAAAVQRTVAVFDCEVILNENVHVRDVRSGKPVAQMSADMRGNTDESWSRTLDWLVRNRLLVAGHGVVE